MVGRGRGWIRGPLHFQPALPPYHECDTWCMEATTLIVDRKTKTVFFSAECWGVRFDANRDIEMKEWLTVDPSHEADWTGLAKEAFVCVQGSCGGRRK